jgi:hypothetical protein
LVTDATQVNGQFQLLLTPQVYPIRSFALHGTLHNSPVSLSRSSPACSLSSPQCFSTRPCF